MQYSTAFSQLRDTLACLYSDPTSARRIVDDSGLNCNNIAFSPRSVDNWHAILTEAFNTGQLDTLITVVLHEYSNNLQLHQAWQTYRETSEQKMTINLKTGMIDNVIAKPQVFISYGKEDKAVALDLYHKFGNAGFRPWIDQEDIFPGEEWDLKIRNSLKSTDFLVVCISEKCTERRGYIQREIKMAVDIAEEMPEGAIFLIPIRLDECNVPSRLAKYQYVDLYAPNGFNKVIQAIKTQWEKI